MLTGWSRIFWGILVSLAFYVVLLIAHSIDSIKPLVAKTTTVVNKVDAIADAVSNPVGTVVDKAKDVAVGVVSTVKNGAKSVWKKVTGWFS